MSFLKFLKYYIYYEFKLFVIHPTYYTSLLVICSAHSFDLILKQKKYSESIFIISFLKALFNYRAFVFLYKYLNYVRT